MMMMMCHDVLLDQDSIKTSSREIHIRRERERVEKKLMMLKI